MNATTQAGGLALLVVALARPQETKGWTTTSTEGVAIQIVYDRSGSMREPMPDNESMTKNEVARDALVKFIKGDGGTLRGREGDMVGLIAFARFADHRCGNSCHVLRDAEALDREFRHMLRA